MCVTHTVHNIMALLYKLFKQIYSCILYVWKVCKMLHLSPSLSLHSLSLFLSTPFLPPTLPTSLPPSLPPSFTPSLSPYLHTSIPNIIYTCWYNDIKLDTCIVHTRDQLLLATLSETAYKCMNGDKCAKLMVNKSQDVDVLLQAPRVEAWMCCHGWIRIARHSGSRAWVTRRHTTWHWLPSTKLDSARPVQMPSSTPLRLTDSSIIQPLSVVSCMTSSRANVTATDYVSANSSLPTAHPIQKLLLVSRRVVSLPSDWSCVITFRVISATYCFGYMPCLGRHYIGITCICV